MLFVLGLMNAGVTSAIIPSRDPASHWILGSATVVSLSVLIGIHAVILVQGLRHHREVEAARRGERVILKRLDPLDATTLSLNVAVARFNLVAERWNAYLEDTDDPEKLLTEPILLAQLDALEKDLARLQVPARVMNG